MADRTDAGGMKRRTFLTLWKHAALFHRPTRGRLLTSLRRAGAMDMSTAHCARAAVGTQSKHERSENDQQG